MRINETRLSFVAGAGVLAQNDVAPVIDRPSVDEAFSKAYGEVTGRVSMTKTRDEVSDTPATGIEEITRLIRKAQDSPNHPFELQRGYSGRAQAELAKAAEAPTPKPKVVAADLDHVSPTLRKALADFDARVSSFNRRPGMVKIA
jgi:hypothetical protein